MTSFKITRDNIKYTIKKYSDGHRSITCKRCGMESHHPLDVSYKYCDNCKLFISTLNEIFGAEVFKEDQEKL